MLCGIYVSEGFDYGAAFEIRADEIVLLVLVVVTLLEPFSESMRFVIDVAMG